MVSRLAAKALKVKIKDTEVTGLAYKQVVVDKVDYVFGSFQGKTMLVRKSMLEVTGDITVLEKEIW